MIPKPARSALVFSSAVLLRFDHISWNPTFLTGTHESFVEHVQCQKRLVLCLPALPSISSLRIVASMNIQATP